VPYDNLQHERWDDNREDNEVISRSGSQNLCRYQRRPYFEYPNESSGRSWC